MYEQSIEQQVGAAVSAVWAQAIPPVALQALWARGDVAPVYAIAGLHSPETRPFQLAWFSALDPEPHSSRVKKASLAALQQARDDEARLPALALVPLAEHSTVLNTARRLADRDGDEVLSLRTCEFRGTLASGTMPALEGALRATWLAEHGRVDEAEAALVAALGELGGEAASEAALILAMRRLGGWGRASDRPWAGLAVWAAFVAGQVDLAAAEQFLESRGTMNRYVAATLAAGRAADAWHESFGWTEERMEELYLEGWIDEEGRWAARVGNTLIRPHSYQDVNALLAAMLVEAHGAASRFAESLLSDAGSQRDHAVFARRVQAMRADVEEASGESPPWLRAYRRLLGSARALVAVGGAAEVRESLEALERHWGPADEWGRYEPAFVEAASVELLACAEGRALAALRRLTEQMPAIAARVQVCAGLARDGNLEELRGPLVQALEGPLEPDEVLRLVPPVLAVEPTARAAIEQGIAQTLGSLPAGAEAAAAWLDRQALAASRRH
ncbi:hypothetical protein [Nannocystis punicea]|uniref:Uncharacterized protein n=1 Tax=Nannocystis punicea TaxID=2995304 RepID=A0ABY7GX39_9BACT|nr:hypothetical protein [Nannocystis poenicansa]WAS91465.1 hypothetical protein O0S08_35225 [Nannocystis poenicansa]